jgi:hypothetical protein
MQLVGLELATGQALGGIPPMNDADAPILADIDSILRRRPHHTEKSQLKSFRWMPCFTEFAATFQ